MLLVAAEPATLSQAIAIGADGAPAGWAAQAAEAVRPRLLPGFGYAVAKRTIDIAGAALLLLMLLPVLAVVGLGILLESGGPILYRGERVGRFGKTFRVAKFRSMRAGCDSSPHAAYVRSLLVRQEEQGGLPGCTLYKVPDDLRITRLGRLLRRTSLDELPQLWNVLRGEMSLVGPRPDVSYAVELYDDSLHRRLLVKPGITGLWQVSGRSRLSLREMYRLDLDYVAQASLAVDVRILLRTIPAVFGEVGAA